MKKYNEVHIPANDDLLDDDLVDDNEAKDADECERLCEDELRCNEDDSDELLP